jgi:hypothetical protein
VYISRPLVSLMFGAYPAISYHYGSVYEAPYVMPWGLPELAPVFGSLSPHYQPIPTTPQFIPPPANLWDTAGWSGHVNIFMSQFTMQQCDGQYSEASGAWRMSCVHVTFALTWCCGVFFDRMAPRVNRSVLHIIC